MDRNVLYTAGGFLALLGGRKVVALSLFGKGLAGLERAWRNAHPDFHGGFGERWLQAVELYDATHQHPVNRRLHTIGIPFIAAGAGGLLLFPAFRPLWALSALSFAGGWALNFIGHGFERNAPAFATDPLSFVAGPVWDLRQVLGGARPRGAANGKRAGARPWAQA